MSPGPCRTRVGSLFGPWTTLLLTQGGGVKSEEQQKQKVPCKVVCYIETRVPLLNTSVSIHSTITIHPPLPCNCHYCLTSSHPVNMLISQPQPIFRSCISPVDASYLPAITTCIRLCYPIMLLSSSA
ncbi:hypothetical protein L226DRAFT_90121 [Lentinus tigrinus ALCF2SS1-7]|uniref:Uncharacterized protein n=1 Tax=Lentinus tigrinus ALCF2SS1-6 TaxID=1328759 RepID=A0A5C2RUK3_9APHY|nr:hypothetical protein L227DRAFT_343766 [Lentinus tigrinus ALCF2SS1-6]RPD73884.1 hypothetical protein L226DRAFT_90121 [Lentinus tigrinus ALCF2SS1-7]